MKSKNYLKTFDHDSDMLVCDTLVIGIKSLINFFQWYNVVNIQSYDKLIKTWKSNQIYNIQKNCTCGRNNSEVPKNWLICIPIFKGHIKDKRLYKVENFDFDNVQIVQEVGKETLHRLPICSHLSQLIN